VFLRGLGIGFGFWIQGLGISVFLGLRIWVKFLSRFLGLRDLGFYVKVF